MSSPINSHRDLRAWQLAFRFTTAVYAVTNEFPKEERFGIISQLRRSTLSIPSNIAEGFGRGSSLDYARFLKIARGSLFEVDTQILLCLELGYITQPRYDELHRDWTDISKVLSGLIRSIDLRAREVKRKKDQ